MKGYTTSKDYKRLKELLDKGYTVLICCFDEELGGMYKGDNSWPGWEWGARYGFETYNHSRTIYGEDLDGFERQCYQYGIEFIEPTEE